MKALISLAISVFVLSSHAETRSSLQQLLDRERKIRTQESYVSIKGTRYKKVEAEGKHFYISLASRQGDAPILYCERPSGWESEHLINGSLKILRRKILYLSALKESCNTASTLKSTKIALSPMLGVYLPKSQRDLIKNKKLGIDPNRPNEATFSGEF